MTFKPSEQQIDCNKKVSNGDNLLIIAGAGAGKSTSLRYFAQENSDKNFLVLCFNKANADESNAHPNKPKNIFYATGHSVAYSEIVSQNMRAKFNNSGLQYSDINESELINTGALQFAKNAREEKAHLTLLKKHVLQAIMQYCRSDSRKIIEFAKTYFDAIFAEGFYLENDPILGEVKIKTIELPEEMRENLAKFTHRFWLDIIDPNKGAKFGHDQYLKLFQLRNCSVNNFFDKISKQRVSIDVVCLDEAQDSNPVMLDIFNNFNGQKIIVGDSAQQLYAWRGAVDAMRKFHEQNANVSLGYLTQSYRFNEEIAEKANKVLAFAKQDFEVQGCGTTEEIKTAALLFRTNAAAISYLFSLLEENPNLQVNLNIDLDSSAKKMFHLQAVNFGEEPKYPDASLHFIKTKDDLVEAMQISPDIEQLVMLAQYIGKKGGGLATGIKAIKNACNVASPITISTIHKSKGLEWDEVIIGNDFLRFETDETGNVIEESAAKTFEEFENDFARQCLLYVALTRAKVQVHYPRYLTWLLGEDNWNSSKSIFERIFGE